MNDIFQFEILGEGPDGKLFGHYKVSRVPPSLPAPAVVFRPRPPWKAALEEAEDDVTR